MVFYFSGTGNSRYVARRLAEGLGDQIYSMSDCLQQQSLSFTLADDERLGFVFPTYFYGFPTLVREFMERLEITGYKTQYIYVITSCGGDSGNLLRQCGRLLAKKGLRLNAADELRQPDNYILMFNLLTPEDKQAQIHVQADKKIEALITAIQQKTLGIARGGIGRWFKTKFSYPLYLCNRHTRCFYTTDVCTGCGLCAQVCPSKTIVMHEGRPQWHQPECTQCLACLHHCSERAVQHKKRTETRGRYLHPNEKLGNLQPAR